VDDAPAKDAVARVGADPRAIARAAEDRLPAASGPAGVDGAVVTPSVHRLLFHAFQVARSSGATYVDPEHLFFALVLAQDAPAGRILGRFGVTPEALLNGAREHQMTGGAEETAEGEGESMLAKYGVDLTERARAGELDPV